MVVGTCRITLSLPGNNSLKAKRKVIRSILDRVRTKFQAAAAEVDEMDVHRRAVLGFCVVSNDARHVNAVLDNIDAFVSSASEAFPVDRSVEILHLD